MRFEWWCLVSVSVMVACGGPAASEPAAAAVRSPDSPDAQRRHPFDRAVAAEAVNSVDVQRCRASGAPPGSGHVVMTFSPAGHVESVAVDDGPFTGAAKGCIENLFVQVHVPPFDGARVRLGKTFTVDDRPAEAGSPLPFDRGAAAKALGTVDIRSCKSASGPRGEGHLIVTFANDGHVVSATVDGGTFPGTPAGDCVASRFMTARVPAFGGPSVRVGKSFRL